MLEIIGFTINGCITAQRAGAHRIELCDNPGEGGTTPSYGFIKAARSVLSIELFPIIRPRGGDFLYNEYEFEIIKSDIIVCKNLGCDGVVAGMLTRNGTVDVIRMRQLVDLAYPMEITFHRAFDRVAEPFKALDDLIAIGCDRILTSGLQKNVYAGKELIKNMVNYADGRISIMPGSGVVASNIAELKKFTGANEFHSSARSRTASEMGYKSDILNETLENYDVNEAEVRDMLAQLNSN